MSDIQVILKEALAAFQVAKGDKKAELASQLGLAFEGILSKLSDFSDIPEHFLTQVDPQVLAQIDAIDKRTEKAVDQFLGASEKLGTIIKDAPGDIKKAVQFEINVMFEASNFQDLVSQHANEIRLLMQDVKADMVDLQNLTGAGDGTSKSDARSRDKNKRSDSHLLNGPPMPTE